jgi:hypothetical protein
MRLDQPTTAERGAGYGAPGEQKEGQTMKMRLRTAALAAGLGVGIAAAAIVATPGAAMASYDDCTVDRLCIYTEPDGNGYRFEVTNDFLSLGSLDNQTSSVYNHHYREWACLYTEPDFRGDHLSIGPGERQTLQEPFAKRVSSIDYPAGGCGG